MSANATAVLFEPAEDALVVPELLEPWRLVTAVLPGVCGLAEVRFLPDNTTARQLGQTRVRPSERRDRGAAPFLVRVRPHLALNGRLLGVLLHEAVHVEVFRGHLDHPWKADDRAHGHRFREEVFRVCDLVGRPRPRHLGYWPDYPVRLALTGAVRDNAGVIA